MNYNGNPTAGDIYLAPAEPSSFDKVLAENLPNVAPDAPAAPISWYEMQTRRVQELAQDIQPTLGEEIRGLVKDWKERWHERFSKGAS